MMNDRQKDNELAKIISANNPREITSANNPKGITSTTKPTKITALYSRLSNEDKLTGESGSIKNLSLLLKKKPC